MVSFNEESIRSQQNINTAVIQSQQNNCGVQNNVSVSGTTVIVNQSRVKGDITAVGITGTNVDATCIMSNQMSQQVEQALRKYLQQTNSSQSDLFSLLEGLTLQTTNINVTENIANQLTQYVASTCYVESTNSVNDTYLYVNGSSANNINGVVINGITANASCAMSNMSKLMNYLDDSTDFVQDASKTGTFGAIFGVFGVIIAVVIGVIILVIVLSMFKKGGKKKGDDLAFTTDEIRAITGIANV